jgi:hypothetical protein
MMLTLRRLLLMAAATVVIGGCGVNVPVTCEEIERDPPAPLSCDAAVDAARVQLAQVGGITALRFQYDECAPNAQRCAFLFGTAGNVIATLGGGREIAVFVGIDDAGAVRADAPRGFTSEPQPTILP